MKTYECKINLYREVYTQYSNAIIMMGKSHNSSIKEQRKKC